MGKSLSRRVEDVMGNLIKESSFKVVFIDGKEYYATRNNKMKVIVKKKPFGKKPIDCYSITHIN